MTTKNDNKSPESDTNYILPTVVDRSVEVAIYASTFSQVFTMSHNGAAATRAAREAVLAHYEEVSRPPRRGPGRPRKSETQPPKTQAKSEGMSFEEVKKQLEALQVQLEGLKPTSEETTQDPTKVAA